MYKFRRRNLCPLQPSRMGAGSQPEKKDQRCGCIFLCVSMTRRASSASTAVPRLGVHLRVQVPHGAQDQVWRKCHILNFFSKERLELELKGSLRAQLRLLTLEEQQKFCIVQVAFTSFRSLSHFKSCKICRENRLQTSWTTSTEVKTLLNLGVLI